MVLVAPKLVQNKTYYSTFFIMPDTFLGLTTPNKAITEIQDEMDREHEISAQYYGPDHRAIDPEPFIQKLKMFLVENRVSLDMEVCDEDAEALILLIRDVVETTLKVELMEALGHEGRLNYAKAKDVKAHIDLAIFCRELPDITKSEAKPEDTIH